jgi:hypothetical protein
MDREQTIARLLAGPHPHRTGLRRDTASWQTMVDQAIDPMRSGRRTAN